MTNRKLLAATALSSGALFMAASATPAVAATAPQTQTATPVTTVTAQDVQTLPTNSTNPADVIPATPTGQTAPRSDNAITVTGSRIRRPNLESVVPVTSIQGEQFFRQGTTSVGDELNDLPQLRSTFAQQNSGLGIGIASLNLLDLRGLAPKRTLVLVNGRRHVAADITSSASVPDVGSIPNDLIDRVDIVTGGNSAVYGSDAIAGVVNFILRRDFDGLQVRAQGAEAGAGFGTNYLTSALLGHNFDGGRGNITLSAEYTHQDRVFGSEVPWLARDVTNAIVVDADPGGLANGSDGFPDRIVAHDIRQATTSLYGMIPFSYNGSITAGTGSVGTFGCGQGISNSNGAPANAGQAYNCNFIFLPDDTLTRQTGARYTTGPLGGYIGGNNTNGREGDLLSIFPKTNRYNLNAVGHYTISDAFEPFFEAKWAHQEVEGNNASPSALSGNFNLGDIRERIRLDNPFLTSAQRTQITTLLTQSNCAPTTGGSCAFFTAPSFGAATTPVTRGLGTYAPVQTVTGQLNTARLGSATGPVVNDAALIANGTYRFTTARLLDDLGIRDEHFKRNTYRGVLGVRGTFNDDWSYEVSGNYGEFHEDNHVFGFLDRQRLMLSLDAGRNPATGQIQCRAQFDPAARIALDQTVGAPFFDTTNFVNPAPGVNELNAAQAAAAAAARLNADIAACVPYNPFGSTDNSAAAAYIGVVSHKTAKLTQLDLNGFVNGDTSQWFSLPGGPVSFVLGGEYRRETGLYRDDPYVTQQATNNVIITDFVPPPFHVAEAFGELNIPIIKDQPFFHELTLSGAGRYSHYKKSVGDTWTYNFGGEWAPVRDIRFRANYGKAVRAPNMSETAFPPVANFSPNFADPCSSGNIGANANRTTNCTTALTVAGVFVQPPNVTQSLAVISASNPLLKPEVSHSLTLGFVAQPRFVPGFSASVDYFDIKVKDVIVGLGAQQVANLCYDLPSLNNPFCGLFTRWFGPGNSTLNDQPGQILSNSLQQIPRNFAARIRRGIDLNANYRAHLSSKVTLDTGLIWSHVIKNSNYNDPTNPKFEDRILGELGDPQDEARFDADLKIGQVTLGYQAHFIGPMWVDLFEDWNPLPAACPAGQTTPGIGGCPPNNADFADVQKYPAMSYHSVRFQWDTGPALRLKNIQVYGGVDNIFDKHPPFNLPPGGSLASDRITGGQTAIYDARGRNFYAGIKLRY
ncbi:TonB-dependent receptor domain-containing protein [Sphingomonas sp.]|uniref:TonB-dependent receptor domain-containing protein n=1 Tax=Sphingomonas sp. TaxID=28214 RepID=UPI00389B6ED3